MSPTLFAIVVMSIAGVVAGVLSGTRISQWIKDKSAWVVCILMVVGILGFMIKAILQGAFIIIGFLAKLFS